MRKRTKLLSTLLAMVMVLALLPATALAADTVEINWLPKGMSVENYFEDTGELLASNGSFWYILDQEGNTIAALGNAGEYDFVGTESEGLIDVYRGNDWQTWKWGFIDRSGKLVIPCEYDHVESFSEGLAAVRKDGKYGFVDKTGTLVIPVMYDGNDYGMQFSEGLCPVRIGDYQTGKWGYIDKTGAMVIPASYDEAEGFVDGTALVKKDGIYSLIDKADNATILAKCDELLGMGEWPMMAVDTDETTWESTGYFVDKAGNRINSVQYGGPMGPFSVIEGNGFFSEGLASVCKSGESLFGYIDANGNEVIPAQFTIAANFSNGLAYVEKNGISGYIDRTGKMVFSVPAGVHVNQTEYSASFYDGLVPIFAGDDPIDTEKKGLMNTKGEIVLPAVYDGIGVYGAICSVLDGDRVGIFQNPYYTPAQPEQPTQPTETEAMPTNDKLTVNGVLQTPTVYKINGGNYFKLRDLAVLLNGTSCQFDVGYDAASSSVTATSGKGYTKLDGDMAGPASGNQTATLSNDKIIVNGQVAQVEVYKIDGGNYFKLRDLGNALGFDVGWDDANKVASITTNG